MVRRCLSLGDVGEGRHLILCGVRVGAGRAQKSDRQKQRSDTSAPSIRELGAGHGRTIPEGARYRGVRERPRLRRATPLGAAT